MRNIIFVPVGQELSFHEAYDKNNHWRYTKSNRDYEVIAYQYNDFDIEPDTYDYLIKDVGFKWDLAKHFLDTFDWRDYNYIGFWDDDLVTDIQSVNRGLEIAEKNDMKLFQLSTLAGSASSHLVLHQNKDWVFSRTNFIEGMAPFFHTSMIPILLDFWEYHKVYSGWGFDMIFTSICRERAGVIHEVSMYHPDRPSNYDKHAAFNEMEEILNKVYPKFMQDKYGTPDNTDIDWTGSQRHEVVYEFTMKG